MRGVGARMGESLSSGGYVYMLLTARIILYDLFKQSPEFKPCLPRYLALSKPSLH